MCHIIKLVEILIEARRQALHLVFVDLEKAEGVNLVDPDEQDCSMRLYIKVIQYMYKDSLKQIQTLFRSNDCFRIHR